MPCVQTSVLVNHSTVCAAHISWSLAGGCSFNNLQHAARSPHVSLYFTLLTLLRMADRKRQVSGRGDVLSIYTPTPQRKLCCSVVTRTRLFGLFKVLKKTGTAYSCVLDYNTHKQVSF